MASDTFNFKKFTIHQDSCAMKVGTDGVLLGAWANTKTVHHILDIGTGTGLISLMMAQRFNSAQITAVEIDPLAAKQCQENFQASPWANRLQIIPKSLKDADPDLSSYFDCIVSNPPFYNATLKPEDESRAIARHKDSLPISEIAHFAKKHLTQEGSLCLIYPTAYDSEVMFSCIQQGLQPIRICDVLTKVGKTCKRRMAAFQLQGNVLTLIKEVLPLRNSDGGYSEEYRHLVDDFYISLK